MSFFDEDFLGLGAKPEPDLSDLGLTEADIKEMEESLDIEGMRERLLLVVTTRITNTLMGGEAFKVEPEDVIAFNDLGACALLAYDAISAEYKADHDGEEMPEALLHVINIFNDRLASFVRYAIEADYLDESEPESEAGSKIDGDGAEAPTSEAEAEAADSLSSIISQLIDTLTK